MSIFDLVIVLVLLLFVISGFSNGFIKKIIGIACLVLALLLGIKFSSDVSQLVFEPIGLSGRIGFACAFVIIVVGITMTQSLIYNLMIKKMVDKMWNKVLGAILGIFEGSLALSIALILMSIYLNIPAEETKGRSQLYKPMKNFAPMVFDQVNTLLPESEDFYMQIMNYATEKINSLEK
jgi:membrane protein required for colicin V production